MDLLKYAAENGIQVSATPKAPWSTDANFMHISYESGILENPNNEAPEDLYSMTKNPLLAPEKPYRLEISFVNGLPDKVKTEDGIITDKVEMFEFLNSIGGSYGVGRIDIVENRYIGLKVIFKHRSVVFLFSIWYFFTTIKLYLLLSQLL